MHPLRSATTSRSLVKANKKPAVCYRAHGRPSTPHPQEVDRDSMHEMSSPVKSLPSQSTRLYGFLLESSWCRLYCWTPTSKMSQAMGWSERTTFAQLDLLQSASWIVRFKGSSRFRAWLDLNGRPVTLIPKEVWGVKSLIIALTGSDVATIATSEGSDVATQKAALGRSQVLIPDSTSEMRVISITSDVATIATSEGSDVAIRWGPGRYSHEDHVPIISYTGKLYNCRADMLAAGEASRKDWQTWKALEASMGGSLEGARITPRSNVVWTMESGLAELERIRREGRPKARVTPTRVSDLIDMSEFRRIPPACAPTNHDAHAPAPTRALVFDSIQFSSLLEANHCHQSPRSEYEPPSFVQADREGRMKSSKPDAGADASVTRTATPARTNNDNNNNLEKTGGTEKLRELGEPHLSRLNSPDSGPGKTTPPGRTPERPQDATTSAGRPITQPTQQASATRQARGLPGDPGQRPPRTIEELEAWVERTFQDSGLFLGRLSCLVGAYPISWVWEAMRLSVVQGIPEAGVTRYANKILIGFTKEGGPKTLPVGPSLPMYHDIPEDSNIIRKAPSR